MIWAPGSPTTRPSADPLPRFGCQGSWGTGLFWRLANVHSANSLELSTHRLSLPSVEGPGGQDGFNHSCREIYFRGHVTKPWMAMGLQGGYGTGQDQQVQPQVPSAWGQIGDHLTPLRRTLHLPLHPQWAPHLSPMMVAD